MMNAAYQRDFSAKSPVLRDAQELAESPVRFEYGMTLAAIEKEVILETLKRQNYNRTRAARVLGIGIRTLQRKLKQYNGDAVDGDDLDA